MTSGTVCLCVRSVLWRSLSVNIGDTVPLGILSFTTNMSRFLAQLLPRFVLGSGSQQSLVVDLDGTPVLLGTDGSAILDC